jgi:hypothetical protein
LSVAYLVGDPDAFTDKVLYGERVDKVKDSAGQLMRDNYLANRLVEE